MSSGPYSSLPAVELEIPILWCENPLVGAVHQGLVVNLMGALATIGAKVTPIELNSGQDFAPRRTRGVMLSYHSIGNSLNVWRIKEAAIPNYFSFDRYGYSGWSEFASSKEMHEMADSIDLEFAHSVLSNVRSETISRNVSKYPQTDKDFPLPNGFVFFPLQMVSDTVIQLSRLDYLDALNKVIEIANERRAPLVLKRHPLCKDSEISNILESAIRSKHSSIFLTEASIHDCIEKASSVICCNSGVGFEALLHGKPVFAFGVSDYSAVTEQIYTLDSLESAFEPRVTVSPERRDKYLAYYLTEYCFDARNRNDIIAKLQRAFDMYGITAPDFVVNTEPEPQASLFEPTIAPHHRITFLLKQIARKDSTISQLGEQLTSQEQQRNDSDAYRLREEVAAINKQNNTAIQRLEKLLAASQHENQTLVLESRELKAQLGQIKASRIWRMISNVAGALHTSNRRVRGFVRGISGHEASHYKTLASSSLFDPKWYLSKYPDVAEQKIDPIRHYLDHGHTEGRDPGPYFCTASYLQVNGDVALKNINALLHYELHGKKEGRSVSSTVTPLDTELPATGEGNEFLQFVMANMDRDAYLNAYPDVKNSHIDPINHWLNHGLKEGRSLSPRFTVKLGEPGEQSPGVSWLRFEWRGTVVFVRKKVFRESLLKQIKEQARHDSAVMAAGALALAELREFDAPDLMARDGVDEKRIFSTIPARPNVLAITPFLTTGGAEKYLADLVESLEQNGFGSILVLVSDQTAEMAQGWETLKILASFSKATVLFWPDICGPGYSNPTVLARFINALGPSYLIVNNSRVGLDAVSRFGRGLSQFSRIFCTYFSLGVLGLGAPYGTRFPHRTLLFATALTDNAPMAAALRRLWGGLSEYKVAELPPKICTADERLFRSRLDARQERFRFKFLNNKARRWVWVSRIEPFKGTMILANIARSTPGDEFYLYGPIDGTLEDLELSLPNIRHCGTLADVGAANFIEYDGFIFTSLFEGMPNIVIEMSQHGIPMVLAEVGGLRNTFDDKAAVYVEHENDMLSTVNSFRKALDRVRKLTAKEASAMAEAAYHQAIARHSVNVHLKKVAELFSATDAHV